MSEQENITRAQVVISTIRDALNAGYLKVDDWEIGFIDSIDARLSSGKELTWKQSKKMNEIFKKIE